ncbi:prepilin-type N-terminal cleavage/methylation domain-containing protein, partial [Patescibacteria group bacterium]|nr:prepilin-type N-terminal cleavage/methylation domain-containing protein [Patescibacteria group bacterium]
KKMEQLPSKSGGGFTLLEVLVAIFVIMVGIAGTLGVIQQGISYTQLSSSRLTANYWAQEGIEIIRNIRDTNWLEWRTNPDILWLDGILSDDWEADYKTQNLTQNYAGTYLNIDNSGFYSYFSGSPTKFKREISIQQTTPPDPNIFAVIVEVSWSERGRDYQVTVQENLYNWR